MMMKSVKFCSLACGQMFWLTRAECSFGPEFGYVRTENGYKESDESRFYRPLDPEGLVWIRGK